MSDNNMICEHGIEDPQRNGRTDCCPFCRIAALEAEVATERERRQREDVAHMKVLGEVDEERIALKARLRETAQILIAKVGADGPMNAEDAARKAVERIAALEAEVHDARNLRARCNRDGGQNESYAEAEAAVCRYIALFSRVAELEAALADAERRADVSEQLVADLSCGHGVATEHRAALARVAELEAALAATLARVAELEDILQRIERGMDFEDSPDNLITEAQRLIDGFYRGVAKAALAKGDG